MTKTRTTARDFAGLRAARTRLQNRHDATRSRNARREFKAQIAELDAQLVNAPEKPEHVPADRGVAALKAHRTRAELALKGKRGKARAELIERIAEFDARIAA